MLTSNWYLRMFGWRWLTHHDFVKHCSYQGKAMKFCMCHDSIIIRKSTFHHFCDSRRGRIAHMTKSSILAAEVSQKSLFAFPCCMGSIIFFDSHAAWECEKHFLRHLPSENAIFFIFSTPLRREAQKSWKCSLRTIASASRRQRRGQQIVTKIASCTDGIFLDRKSCCAKM